MLQVAEHARALGDSHGKETAGPAIDVSENMAMDGAIMSNAEAPRRQRFGKPLRRRIRFECVEIGLRAKSKTIFQNPRSAIAIGIDDGAIHCALSFFRVLFVDRAATLRIGQATTLEIGEHSLAVGVETHALDSADARKAHQPQGKGPPPGNRIVSLRHLRRLSRSRPAETAIAVPASTPPRSAAPPPRRKGTAPARRG
ncbi:hypothetical protein EDE12_10965 [Methylosinus sp. sav-2]|nr:hypothetical protein EDE12_10965 [Methylosinus sp. sav-2]